MNEKKNIWDQWNSGTPPRYPHGKVVQFLFRRYPHPEGRAQFDVLDQGCGSGVHMVLLAREGFRAHGRDLSPVAIENTIKGMSGAGLSPASLATGTIERIDMPDESFDAIICIGVLECAAPESLAPGLAEMARVLRPGGAALAIFASELDFRCQGRNPLGLHGFTDAEVRKAVDNSCAGLKAVWIDRYITTYENNKHQQNEHILTLLK